MANVASIHASTAVVPAGSITDTNEDVASTFDMVAIVEIQTAVDTLANVASIHASTAVVPTGSITDTQEGVASTAEVVTSVEKHKLR